MSPEEEEEVRTLLIRHKNRIINDIKNTELIKILVKNSVITQIDEELLMLKNVTNNKINDKLHKILNNSNSIDSYNSCSSNTSATSNSNNSCSNGGNNNSTSISATISDCIETNSASFKSAKCSINEKDTNDININNDDDNNDDDDDDNDTISSSNSKLNKNIKNNLNNNDDIILENQCVKLIDIIAKNGFDRFKKFCYAIETECPQLIEDLINDRLKSDANSIVLNSSNEEKIKEEMTENPEKQKLELNRAKRSTSYCGSIALKSLPIAAPRRKSLMSVPPPPPPHDLSKITADIEPIIIKSSPTSISVPGKFPESELNLTLNQRSDNISISSNKSNLNSINSNNINLINHIQSNYQSPSSISSNYSSLLCHAANSATSSPVVVKKREKLLHRFSDAATLGRKFRRKKNSNRSCHSMTETIELLGDPVIEDHFFGDRTSWEYHTVSVTRVPGYGFGIAVSGGRDNPHFANGDPSIAVSDVLKGGPAEDKLQVNDRIITVNGVSLENVEYATAVQVLRDSGNTVTLVVKRRVPIIPMAHTHNLSGINLPINNPVQVNLQQPITNSNVQPGQPIKVMITKSNKKEDFGIVLGCRLFIKEISSKARDQLATNGYSLQEGDIVTRIHNTNCNDSMSIKEAKKIIDGCKERLNLVVLRDVTNQNVTNLLNSNNTLNNSGVQSAGVYSHAQQVSNCSNNLDDAYLNGGANYSSQNLYVQPPTRGNGMPMPLNAGPLMADEKSNLTPRGRSRGPIMDVSLSQLDRPSTPSGGVSRRNVDDPPRPPPPRGEDFYSTRRQLYEEDSLQRSQRQSAEPRFISFQKEGSVGIRLTGGNEAGIFVTAVQPGSPASLQGLIPGDKILKVNDMDMHGVTREEAVLFLLSLQDRIDLIVQYCKDEYEEVVTNQRGDSFHIKTHFHCENPSKGEMTFKAGDCFRVVDTLHNGVVGSWQVLKIGRGHQEMTRGVIPNKSRAEELATAQFNASKKEMNSAETRGNFFRRRRSNHRRSKSLSRENWDDVVFSDSISKFPAYERVVLRHPGFVRPVVLFGPVSDIAREKLIKDFSDKFTAPLQDDDKSTKCRIVRLSNIRDIMDRGKHALLDITPNAVDRLNYAQFYPIVIFLKTDSKHVIKQLRHGLPKSAHKSSKKLLEQCQKLERIWSHVFSTQIMLNDTESWYRKLREAIDLQQSGAVWMSETKPMESLSDDFLFPMTTSRLSYASSPESDLELSPGPSASLSLGNLPQLVKSSSDPSIATNQDNLDRDRDIIGDGLPPPYTHPYEHTNSPQNRNKFSFLNGQSQSTLTPDGHMSQRPQPIYGINAPDLPPRIDRGVKPPTNGQLPSSGTPSRNNSSGGGTVGRSAQERLFGGTPAKQMPDNENDDYNLTNQNTDSIDRTQNSLDRHQHSTSNSTHPNSKQNIVQNGSYDSVSSYDSYNTTQLSVQNIRLGPNAPDDLKSVPSANARAPPPIMGTNAPEYGGVHEHSRSFGGANDLNRQNSPARSQYQDPSRNIDARNPQLNLPQRPSNLLLETKTDYGKYSRNNSATQADYAGKIPKQLIAQQTSINGQMPGQPTNGTMPFKPVPPPKPKNYRPPIQSGSSGSGGANYWDNGDADSPRSPNGMFYPPTPSHYHHNQTAGSPAQQSQAHAYGGSNNHFIQQQQQYASSNGYNGHAVYNGQQQYIHRGHPPSIGNNMPHHAPERQSLDLAGSREQRGSAFELYRKPQIGVAGHHLNMSDMEPYDRYYNDYAARQQYHQQQQQCNRYHQQNSMSYPNDDPNYQHFYANRNRCTPPPLPPPLPSSKIKKKSVLKSPLAALKNAFMKSTRPLRRMNSMVEPEKKLKPCLRRQHSMMERNIGQVHYPDENYPNFHTQPMPSRHQQSNYNHIHEQYYQNNNEMQNTYQNLETEDIYRNAMRSNDPRHHRHPQDNDDLYANRALIDLERRQAESRNVHSRRIIRRHSNADRTGSQKPVIQQRAMYDPEDIYQSRQGAYMIQERRAPGSEVLARRRFYTDYNDEPVYQSRREMHRSHLYQSRKEMQERIAQGKREIKREFSPPQSSSQSDRDDKSDHDSVYQSRREMIRESPGLKSRSQLREQIYQTRRDAMESMAEPLYVSKRDIIKHEPIYEAKEENQVGSSKENITDEKKTEEKEVTICENISAESTNSDLQRSNDTVVENTILEGKKEVHKAPLADTEDDDEFNDEVNDINLKSTKEEISSKPGTPREIRAPFHISNIIKRTAPPPGAPPPITASRTSIETQYTSQASLPVGPPVATSTPYTSDMSLPMSGSVPVANLNKNIPSSNSNSNNNNSNTPPAQFPTVPREPITTRGYFDENGGTLCDQVWNVSLQIPPGAIAPNIKQEIYFTVTDPRMSSSVGGPPLDMENGETMLSPLVMCGPQGLEFNVPVTLNIPHCANRTPSLGLNIKATDSERNLRTEWDNIDLPSSSAAHTVSVKVDHF